MANQNTLLSTPEITQTNPTAESAFPTITGGALRAIIAPNATGRMDGHAWRLRVGMRITGGTTTNFTPALRFDSNANTNLTTFTGDTALTAISAFAVNTTTQLFFLTADLYWDSVSQKMNGNFTVQNGATFTAWAAMSGIPITVTSQGLIRFLVTGFFSATNAGNLVTLTDFSLDAV